MLQIPEVGLFGHTWQRLTGFYDYVLCCPKDMPFILHPQLFLEMPSI